MQIIHMKGSSEKTTKWSDITAEGTALGTGTRRETMTLKGSHNKAECNAIGTPFDRCDREADYATA